MKGETLDSTQYWQPVKVHNDRQFVTGEKPDPGADLTDAVYGQALDTLVIGCADIIPLHKGKIFIGLRSWEPQPDWWCFGGRMYKGDLFQIAAARNAKRELYHNVDEVEISSDRFIIVGVYNLVWNKRAQAPIDNGCHTISITMMLSLTEAEVALIHTNEEYRATSWISPEEIMLRPDLYHPCLLQMARDTATLIASTQT